MPALNSTVAPFGNRSYRPDDPDVNRTKPDGASIPKFVLSIFSIQYVNVWIFMPCSRQNDFLLRPLERHRPINLNIASDFSTDLTIYSYF